jgi:hypothetical protein
MGGQAVVVFVVQPIAGYGSDIIPKALTKSNDGVIEVFIAFGLYKYRIV